MAHELYKKSKVSVVDINYQETADGEISTFCFEISNCGKFVDISFTSDRRDLIYICVPLQVLRTFMRAASA
jgi:hypothetical protein